MYCGEFCASGEGASPEDCQCRALELRLKQNLRAGAIVS